MICLFSPLTRALTATGLRNSGPTPTQGHAALLGQPNQWYESMTGVLGLFRQISSFSLFSYYEVLTFENEYQQLTDEKEGEVPAVQKKKYLVWQR